jgi:Ser/Thr protein kinase RdoA (MazF antagonist)
VEPTLERQGHIVINRQGKNHVVRIVSYVDGVPLSEVQPGSSLFGNLGACLAHLGRALREFEHAGADQSLLWDMKSALRLRELLSHVPDHSLRNRVSDCLDDFERDVLPTLPSLRAQVIHNDYNPDNVLVDPNDSNRPAGVIDFGDMLGSPLIFDVAVAASYLRAHAGNPLSHIAEFVAGYHAVRPLEQTEIDLLPGLILVRLCTTITILSWRESVRGADDPYLEKAASTESSADVFLGRLLELPREDMRNTLRQVCASVDANRL